MHVSVGFQASVPTRLLGSGGSNIPMSSAFSSSAALHPSGIPKASSAVNASLSSAASSSANVELAARQRFAASDTDAGGLSLSPNIQPKIDANMFAADYSNSKPGTCCVS